MSIDEQSPSFRATPRIHAVFMFVTLCYWASLYTYVPILAPYVETLGASYTLVGMVLGSYGLVQIIVRLPLGIGSDRLKKRKPFIVLGMLTGALSCLLFAVTDHIGGALVARSIAGVSASTWVAFTVLYAAYFGKHETSRAMGIISFATAAGQLAGMGASGILAERFGDKATFWVGGAIGLIGMLVAFAVTEPKGGIDRTPMRARDLAQVIKEPTVVRASVLSILAHSVLFITMFGFTPSYALEIGASKEHLTWLSVAFMVPHAVLAYITGRYLAPRFGIWRIITVGFICSSVCTLLIPLTPSFPWLTATQALNGAAQGLHLPLLLTLAIQDISSEKRATAMGFYQAVYAIGMFFGPFLAGSLNQLAGLPGGFVFGGALALGAAALTLLWKQRQPAAELGSR